ncbi:MAG: cellulase family glycosylhydrolase, partial [Oscillospiraceae bacterium]
MTNKSSRGIKRFISAMMAAVMAASALVASAPAMAEDTAAAEPAYSSQMRGLTAFQIVNDMGAGWNLGNSLESSNNETYWGNPATTKGMIDDIARRGFKTLRVPVRWDDHYTNASAYTIDGSYMDRVEEVVNYGLDNDMYVILNVHHNDLQHNVPNTDVISAELTAIWGQIGERFKNYGDKLIFEVNNEPRSEEDWTGNAEYYESVNLCNEAARAAIRATGGNNTDRLVMLPTYCASGDYAKAAAWTKKADDDMIAVSIHAYLPFDFAFEGTGHTDWRDSDYTELAAFFDRMELLFLSKGVPVVIGEFGACNKNNTSDREKYAAIYGELARQFAQQDIPCVWWDNNCYGTGAENFGIYNRSQRSFTYGGIADSLIGAYDGAPTCEEYTTGEDVLSAGGSCDAWGQAVQLDAGTIVTLSAEDTIYCNYTSDSAPEFILQSDSNSAKGWVKVDPDSCTDGVAQWKCSTLLTKFGGDFSDLSRGFIGGTFSSLTVSKVYIPRTSAHTHSYTGTENITILATATTKGRKTIGCSVSGCTAYKVEVFEKNEDVKPTNVQVTPGDGKVDITWNAVPNATKYIVYHILNGQYTNRGTTTATSFTVSGLTNNTKYGFLVQAYVNGAWTKFTAEDIKYATPIAKPVITATPGDGQVKLTWNTVDGASKYIVYSILNGQYTNRGTTTGTSFTVSGLTNNTKYGFLVQAYVDGAWTKFTAEDIKYATPIAKPVITATPGD